MSERVVGILCLLVSVVNGFLSVPNALLSVRQLRAGSEGDPMNKFQWKAWSRIALTVMSVVLLVLGIYLLVHKPVSAVATLNPTVVSTQTPTHIEAPQSGSASPNPLPVARQKHPSVSVNSSKTSAPQPVQATPGSISQSNSGGANVLLGTTGANSPIVGNSITVGEIPKRISENDMNEVVTLLQNPVCKERISIQADQFASAAPFTHDLYHAFKSAGWTMEEPGVNTRMMVGPGVGQTQHVVVIEYGEAQTAGQQMVIQPNNPTWCVFRALRLLGINSTLSRTKMARFGDGPYPPDLITIDLTGPINREDRK
jgi:hypothetical protein